MATYLDAILAHHRARAEADDRPIERLSSLALACPTPRDFGSALRDGRPDRLLSPIAEIKRRSPVRGTFDPELQPEKLASDYERGGAVALSVLTDSDHFGGSAKDLELARQAVGLPVLRKDFTVSVRDLYDARLMGADAVLLIVAALSDAELSGFVELAQELGLTSLVEVHDEADLERALRAGARVIGVNQRDLHTFSVDTTRALRVGAAIPDGLLKVAESGISTRADVESLAAAGFDAALVGEALVTAMDRYQALQDMFFRKPSAPCS